MLLLSNLPCSMGRCLFKRNCNEHLRWGSHIDASRNVGSNNTSSNSSNSSSNSSTSSSVTVMALIAVAMLALAHGQGAKFSNGPTTSDPYLQYFRVGGIMEMAPALVALSDGSDAVDLFVGTSEGLVYCVRDSLVLGVAVGDTGSLSSTGSGAAHSAYESTPSVAPSSTVSGSRSITSAGSRGSSYSGR